MNVIGKNSFSVLYNKKASRPYLPKSLAIVLFTIKELFDYSLPDDLKHSINPNDFNVVIYHQCNTGMNNHINQFLTVADILLTICDSEYQESTGYNLFVRADHR